MLIWSLPRKGDNVKKAGIITFHCADNYGAVLQCYALKKYIETNSIETEIIKYEPSFITDNYKVFPSKETKERYLKKGGIKYLIKELYLERIKTFIPRVKKVNKFNSFRKKHIGIKGKVIKDISKAKLQKYDYYIAGSDQIWNPKLTNGIDDAYYLEFAPNDKVKIAYAASLGVDNIEGYEELIKEKLNNFDYIAVREKTGKDILEKISDKNLELVIDPVFLLSQQQWIDIIDDKKRIKEKFIFLYCFDNNKPAIEWANYLSDKYNLPIVHFYFGGLRAKIKNDGGCFYFDGPIDFLWYIKNAEYIVTSSFHCIAFSIIYEKQFYPFIYADRGSRIVDLIESLQVDTKIYSYESKLEDFIEKEIYYDNISKNIDNLSGHSKNYLKNALKE